MSTAKDSKFTGKYPKSGIENTAWEQLDRMKSFKGAKHIKTEWLTKRNSVRQTHQQPIPGKGAK